MFSYINSLLYTYCQKYLKLNVSTVFNVSLICNKSCVNISISNIIKLEFFFKKIVVLLFAVFIYVSSSC